MKRIPDELSDAAKIDGSTILGRYWRVVLPLIKPAIGTIMIFGFMQSWTEFLWPLIVISSTEKMLLEQFLRF